MLLIVLRIALENETVVNIFTVWFKVHKRSRLSCIQRKRTQRSLAMQREQSKSTYSIQKIKGDGRLSVMSRINTQVDFLRRIDEGITP